MTEIVDDKKTEKKPKTVKVKIWVDGVHLGHEYEKPVNKGDVIDIPEEIATLLIEKEMAQKC